MLKFFRRIRQEFLAENKTSKYLLYALGEILLVVIGILIALQINNWNELSKLKDLEKVSLIELNNSLEEGVDELNEGIEYCTKILDKILLLKKHIHAKKPYEDYLDSLWIYPVLGYEIRPNRSAFNALENRGIELITNKTLRNKITRHFNVTEQSTVNDFEVIKALQLEFLHYYFNLVYPRVNEAYIRNYGISNDPVFFNEFQLPLDYEELLEHPLIIAKLNHRANTNILSIHNCKELIAAKEILISEIKMELKNLGE